MWKRKQQAKNFSFGANYGASQKSVWENKQLGAKHWIQKSEWHYFLMLVRLIVIVCSCISPESVLPIFYFFPNLDLKSHTKHASSKVSGFLCNRPVPRLTHDQTCIKCSISLDATRNDRRTCIISVHTIILCFVFPE